MKPDHPAPFRRSPNPADRRAEPVLRPGATCWRTERAGRVAVLVDGADYFTAARAAMERARRSILLIGWDIDPRMRLDPTRPETLGRFLTRLMRSRPELHIRALKWDMPFPIELEHPHEPLERLDRSTGRRLNARLDSELPVGAAQHQKLLIVDDALAFCGGIDLSFDRWDTSEHRDDDPRRLCPNGEPYGPRHDVMMMVDGDAARALAELGRERWRCATGETLEPCPAPEHDPWPDCPLPDCSHPVMTDVMVGVSRTLPATATLATVREGEALTFAAIAAAERTIYLENQYFASARVAEALARRLAEPDGPEVVLVVSMESPSWFDRMAMDTPRSVALRCLRDADRHGRLRAMTPVTEAGKPVIVHSKVMVVDGRLLRIGSSNLNNRSMGYDTECDLTVEAPLPEGPERVAVADAIVGVRNRLLAEHMGIAPERLRAAVREAGSLVAAMDRLQKPSGRRLEPLPADDPSLTEQAFAALRIADPDDPEEAWAPWKRLPAPPRSALRAAGAALLTVGLAAGLWGMTRAANGRRPSNS
ncbi:phospholipase D-like domain-containing protein [Azospirillum picis]|uniref:Phospholipase D n=1 Tax=Azospirillum picis TaxID=488438 RepID=A0ABU0MKB6_9PROT|nr:phospholipase D-like domain-containing protein [Azospirillum picis]MBP2300255.1 phosphatidylserine/phosphatidylglycerophosphate/cardiolipin synthase-like enzyme [Azospirillum picis]MDQ0533903.1 phosphatidylserine/phosphatidylglycerophosphate/cardiolipin synthase-like enzyme [Azospirillum picis]